MISILHLQRDLGITNGITKYIYQLSKYSNKDFNHHVMALNCEASELFTKNSIPLTIFGFKKITPFNIIKIVKTIKKYLVKHQISIIHCHHRNFDTLCWLLNTYFRVHTVTTVQSKVYKYKIISYRSEKLIAIGESIKSHLVKYFHRNENRITLLNNFTCEKEYDIYESSTITKHGLSLDKNKRVILFVGRFSKEKGIDLLLKAYKKIKMTGSNIALILLGSGEENNLVEKYHNDSTLEIKVIAPCFPIIDYYRLADVVVLPSRVDPFPFVMLEAGYLSKPFIGTNVDGIGEVIENEINGLLVEPENENELEKAILRILNDEKQAAKFGSALREKIVKSYTSKRIIPKYEQLYKSLVV
ncbi:MAG: glycosyltransferase family 4 protein [Bacteroidetes bacterium]|nr:glycosyltransferase family 4 protein [Bacteroidota bacterium]